MCVSKKSLGNLTTIRDECRHRGQGAVRKVLHRAVTLMRYRRYRATSPIATTFLTDIIDITEIFQQQIICIKAANLVHRLIKGSLIRPENSIFDFTVKILCTFVKSHEKFLVNSKQ